MAEPKAVQSGLYISTEGDFPTVLPVFGDTGGLKPVTSEQFQQFAQSNPASKYKSVLGADASNFSGTLYDYLQTGSSPLAKQYASFLPGNTPTDSGMYDVGGTLMDKQAAFRTPEQIANDAQVLGQRQAEVSAAKTLAPIQGASITPVTSPIAFKQGLKEDQKQSITALVTSGRTFNDTDARNYAFAIGEPNWQQFVGKTGTQLTSAPQPQSLQQQVEATNPALTANKEYVNALFQVYHGRDANGAELTKFSGQNVGAARDAIKAGAPKGKQATITDPISGDDIETNFTGESGDVNVDPPGEYSSDDLSDALTDAITKNDFDAFLKQIVDAQQAYVKSLEPSAETVDLKKSIADIRAKADLVTQSAMEGIVDVEGQPIPMAFITGQAANIEKRANVKLSNFARLEANLLENLGISVSEDQARQAGAQANYSFLKDNVNLAFQVRESIQAQEDRVWERAQSLKEDSRAVLGDMLEMFKGYSLSQLTPDGQAQLTTLATQAGIPISLISDALDAVKNQMLAKETTGLEDIKQVGDKYFWKNPATGQIEEFDSSNFSLPPADGQTKIKTLLGNAVITGYGSSLNEAGLDMVLDGGVGADVSLPFDFEVIKAGAAGGWGNQVVARITRGSLTGTEVQISHLNNISVGLGSYQAGTSIGGQGNTGSTLTMDGKPHTAEQKAAGRGTHLDITMRDKDGKTLNSREVARLFSVRSDKNESNLDSKGLQEAMKTKEAVKLRSLNELKTSYGSYKTLIEKHGSASGFTPTARALLDSAKTDLQIKYKTAAELGALTGPDLEILAGAIPDVTDEGFISSLFPNPLRAGRAIKVIDSAIESSLDPNVSLYASLLKEQFPGIESTDTWAILTGGLGEDFEDIDALIQSVDEDYSQYFE